MIDTGKLLQRNGYTIPQFQENGVSLFIWDGVAWYDDPRNMTAHTIIATPAVAIASGADIKSVQDLLGHATASFTLNVYAHTSEQMMKDTAARVQNYYDGLAAKG